nr:MAG TPA: hypothetical protein [Caudoviricetes sp.]
MYTPVHALYKLPAEIALSRATMRNALEMYIRCITRNYTARQER